MPPYVIRSPRNIPQVIPNWLAQSFMNAQEKIMNEFSCEYSQLIFFCPLTNAQMFSVIYAGIYHPES